MKLHLPKTLLAILIGVLTLSAGASLGSDTISVNFGDPTTGGVFNDETLGDVGGVTAPFWNHVEGNGAADVNGTYDLKSSGNATFADALTLQTNKDPWGRGLGLGASVLAGMQSSYLDADSGKENWTLTLNFGDYYAISEVKLYFSGDGGSYSAIQFDGVSYVGGDESNKKGSGTWGDRSSDASKTLSGANTLTVNEYLGSGLVIKDTAGAGRDSLSGMQIVLREVYNAALSAGNNVAESLTWTGPNGSSVSYTDLSAADRYLRVNASDGDATLTFAAGAEVDTLEAKGGNVVTVNSSAQSADEKILNVNCLRAEADTRLYIDDVTLGGNTLGIAGQGTVELGDVTFAGTITNLGVLTVSGGQISNLYSKGTVAVSGGKVDAMDNSAGTLTVSGGQIVKLDNSGTVNVSGGQIGTLYSTGTINAGGTNALKDTAVTLAGGKLKWEGKGSTLASLKVEANSELYMHDMPSEASPLELTTLEISQNTTLTVNNQSVWKFWAEVGTLKGSGNLTVNGSKQDQDDAYTSSFTVNSLKGFTGNLSFTSHESKNAKSKDCRLFKVEVNTGVEAVSLGNITFAGFGEEGESSSAILNVQGNTTVKTLSASGTTVSVSAGKNLTIGTSADSADSSIGTLSLANGSTLTYFNRNGHRTSNIGNLTVTGTAEISTLRDPYCYNGTISIGSLNSAGDDASLAFINGAKIDTVTLLNINGGSFSGTLKLIGNSDADAQTNRRLALNLNNETAAQNTVIEFADTTTADDDRVSDPANNYIGIGLGASTVKVAGLNGSTTNSATILGYKIAGNQKAYDRDSSDTSEGARTLELTGSDNYSTNAMIGAGVNLLMSGTGVQTISGDMSNFDGSVTVNKGTLAITTENATNKAWAITTATVQRGALLNLGGAVNVDTLAGDGDVALEAGATLTLAGGTEETLKTHTVGMVTTGAGAGISLEDYATLTLSSTLPNRDMGNNTGNNNADSSLNLNITGGEKSRLNLNLTTQVEWQYNNTVSLKALTEGGKTVDDVYVQSGYLAADVFSGTAKTNLGGATLHVGTNAGGEISGLLIRGKDKEISFGTGEGGIQIDEGHTAAMFLYGGTRTLTDSISGDHLKIVNGTGDSSDGGIKFAGNLELATLTNEAKADVELNGSKVELGMLVVNNGNDNETGARTIVNSNANIAELKVQKGSLVVGGENNSVKAGNFTISNKNASLSNVTVSGNSMTATSTEGAKKGSVSNAVVQIDELAEDASFTIAEMNFSNASISAAKGIKVKLEKITASDTLLTGGGQFQLYAGPQEMTLAEATAEGMNRTLTYRAGLGVSGEGTTLTLNLDVISAVAPDQHGVYDISIVLNGFGEGFVLNETIAGMVKFDPESWLAKALEGVTPIVMQEGAEAIQASNDGPTVTYAAGENVGSLVISIHGLNVPEPASATLSLAALVMLAARRRRRRA